MELQKDCNGKPEQLPKKKPNFLKKSVRLKDAEMNSA